MALQAIKFNTGRPYTPEGQVILAWITHEGSDEFGLDLCVRFRDLSRDISGEIPHLSSFEENSIMAAYDRGMYGNVWLTKAEIEDAMTAVLDSMRG